MSIEITSEFEHSLDLMENTDRSVFITGKAGTGKSTLLRHFLGITKKKHVVLAPTGIAALNVGGQTIHSFFSFPPGIVLLQNIKFRNNKARVMKKLDMLIIDEISMVRVDLMKGIDISLRKHRKRMDLPFGGVQLVMIGDLFQLSPVVPPSEETQLRMMYSGMHFFDAFPNRMAMERVVLTKVYRQQEDETEFLRILNNIRNDQVEPRDLELLNSRYEPDLEPDEESVFLTSRRDRARNVNMFKLRELDTEHRTYTGRLKGKFKEQYESGKNIEHRLPAPIRLELKVGAKVMMVKNDPEKRWVNGTIAHIIEMDDDEILVDIHGNQEIVYREKWQEIRYTWNSQTAEVEEEVLGSYSQFPLQLAYAITIHKSQGKTFEKVIIDIGKGAFAHGQVYVALSRCTTLQGVRLNQPIRPRDIIVDRLILEFIDGAEVVE